MLRVVSAQAIPADWTVLIVKFSLNGAPIDADALNSMTNKCLVRQLRRDIDVLIDRRWPDRTDFKCHQITISQNGLDCHWSGPS
jgi:hypothetical protein